MMQPTRRPSPSFVATGTLLAFLAAGCPGGDDDGSGSAADDDGSSAGPGVTGDTSAGPEGSGSAADDAPATTASTTAATDPTGDTGAPADSGDDTGTTDGAPEGFVPAFIAQGHMGRTMLSCDDGQTWIADTSLDDTVHCFEPLDCDHNEGAGTGITYGEEIFVATWGWGTEGQIQTTQDGIEWTTVLTGPTFAGSAWGADTFITASKYPWRAGPLGDVWTELGDSTLGEWTARGIGFVDVDGGRFILGGGGGTGDVVVTADLGDSWQHPTGVSQICGSSIAGISGGAGAIVIASGQGTNVDLCVSTDGGASFVDVDLPERLKAAAFWTGTEFVGFGDTSRHTSPDGLTWSSEPYASGNVSPTAIARAASGTYVAQRDGWLSWYDQQILYRSTDGLTWTPLGGDAFTGGHPLRHIAFGWVLPHDEGCPAQ